MGSSFHARASNYGSQVNQNFGTINNRYEIANEEATLKLLYYENISAKAHKIYDAAAENLEWIWSDESLFCRWLKDGFSDRRIFWISGKPGSGKSTLMKHIANSRRTLDCLPSSVDWTRIHFFFDFSFKSGTANSIEGLLRSFALQLTRRLRGERTEITDLNLYSSEEKLSADVLLDAICSVVDSSRLNIFALVDGLDEFAGSLADLATFLKKLHDRSGMKMIFASRPEGPLTAALKDCAIIQLQDHNSRSINLYLEAAVGLREHEFLKPLPEWINREIVKESRGVILWARLAIDRLLDLWKQGVSLVVLREELLCLPQDLEEMYQVVLDRMSPPMRPVAAIIFELIPDYFPLSLEDLLGDFTFLSSDIGLGFVPQVSLTQEKYKLHLLANFGSLLDFNDSHHTVSLLHGTLRIYFEKSDWIGQNLPDLFKSRYSVALNLHMYANCIRTASTCLSWTRQKVGQMIKEGDSRGEPALRVLKGFLEKQAWCPWFQLLPRAIDRFLITCKRHQDQHHELHYSLVKSALQSPLMLFHVGESTCGEEIDIHTTSPSSEEVFGSACSWGPALESNDECIHQVYLISHGLSGYVEEGLFMEPQVFAKDNQMLFDFAITKYVENSHAGAFEMIAKIMVSRGARPKTRHLCTLAGVVRSIPLIGLADENAWPSINLLAKDLRGLRPASNQPRHHLDCFYYKLGANHLLSWVQRGSIYQDELYSLTPDTYGDTYHSLERLLNFFLQTGERLDTPCCGEMNPIQAILDISVLDTLGGYNDDPARLIKFVILVEAGAEFVASHYQEILSQAKGLQALLSAQALKPDHNERRNRRRIEDLQDVETIILILEDFALNGKWLLCRRYSTIFETGIPSVEIDTDFEDELEEEIDLETGGHLKMDVELGSGVGDQSKDGGDLVLDRFKIKENIESEDRMESEHHVELERSSPRSMEFGIDSETEDVMGLIWSSMEKGNDSELTTHGEQRMQG